MRLPWLSRLKRSKSTPARRRSSAGLRLEALETRNLLAVVPLSNGIPPGTVGQFDISVNDGGDLTEGRVTAQGTSELISNENVIFDFTNFVDVGSDGGALDLSATTVTQPSTLIGSQVVSSGSFQGQNGTILWRVTTDFIPGTSMARQVLQFQVADQRSTLGNLRFINYLDEDVRGVSDDILVPSGTPGQSNFEVFTLDNQQRVGFSQSGQYSQDGSQLVNATFDGFAADEFSELLSAITGSGTSYSVSGNIDTASLPAFQDEFLGQVFGPNDVTTAFAWSVDPNAQSATITTFARLIPTNVSPPPDGGVVEDENAAFLRQLYRDLLNRAPDSAGFDFHLNNLQTGFRDRTATAFVFLHSAEFFSIEVNIFYRRFLHRNAEPAGLDFWVNELLLGVEESEVAARIAGSEEYSRLYPTNEAFVTALYDDILERGPDLPGFLVHVNALNARF